MVTLTLQPGPADGLDMSISEQYPTTNYKNDTSFFIMGSEGTRFHALLKFTLPALPVGAVVTAATLVLYGDGWGSNGWLNLYRVLAANTGWTADATWNFADGAALRWAGDTGGDGGTDAGCGVSGTDYSSTLLGTHWFTSNLECLFDLDLTEFGLLRAANYGIIVRANTTEAVFKTPWSSNAGTAENRPKLVITYTLPGGGNVFQSAIMHSAIFGRTLVR